jgi:hypothetical protein|tara:strand:+ start:873 stop:1214 length:342 start_codon:yes stop_codon:yes gene_type:complete
MSENNAGMSANVASMLIDNGGHDPSAGQSIHEIDRGDHDQALARANDTLATFSTGVGRRTLNRLIQAFMLRQLPGSADEALIQSGAANLVNQILHDMEFARANGSNNTIPPKE